MRYPCGPIEGLVRQLNDSLKSVLLINETQDFITNGYEDFSAHFYKNAPQKVLKKAFRKRKYQKDDEILSCIKGIPIVTFERVDSIRAQVRHTRIDHDLEDSISEQINFIYRNFDGRKRDSLAKLIIEDERYKSLEAKRRLMEVYSLLISRPVMVDDRYLFIQISIVSSEPHFLTRTFLFKKASADWRFVSQYSW